MYVDPDEKEVRKWGKNTYARVVSANVHRIAG